MVGKEQVQQHWGVLITFDNCVQHNQLIDGESYSLSSLVKGVFFHLLELPYVMILYCWQIYVNNRLGLLDLWGSMCAL